MGEINILEIRRPDVTVFRVDLGAKREEEIGILVGLDTSQLDHLDSRRAVARYSPASRHASRSLIRPPTWRTAPE